jgi:outer membrane cobalamin receptor
LVTLSTSDKAFKFSLFYKQGYREFTDYKHNIFGIDINYLLLGNISLYAGYSLRNVYWISENVPSFESGIRYNTSNLHLDLKYFYNEYFNYELLFGGPEIIQDHHQEKVRGVGLILNYKLGLLLLETNTSYYFEVDDERPINLPDWQFVGGLYVNDMFFDNNLDLKAGFKFYYTGEINSSLYYWWRSTVVEPTNKLDFNLAGEIQKVAIFYFQWENLFGNEYYITPYYPMPERNIKFGIAWEMFN